jgi:putative PIN family toxin of toxin-antitoxin system
VRVVLDTNVFVSGVFFSGPPYRILQSWRDGRLKLALSLEILDEYHRVGQELAAEFAGADLASIEALLATHAEVFDAPPLPQQVCADPDDDKFLACALASRIKIVVSGDKELLRVTGWGGIQVLRPRAFIDLYLSP